MLLFRSLVLAASSLAMARGQGHWAVLVAGSMGYYNYRHQADICHAYHVLVARGFHPERIITMMYDDVASSAQNPFPGKLYNFPWKTAGEAVDVYSGCQIDYRGDNVTPSKFLSVLTGDAHWAGGRVLRSQANDHVFINFVDHGGVGLISFPYLDSWEGSTLHAQDLISTLETMYQQGLYKQLVFYLETCESGSMFESLLPEGLPVYALTAANARESSWGTFCGYEAMVAGVSLHSCLGDLFSVNWMTDSEGSLLRSETLETQFESVRNATTKSHVMQYGQYASFDGELVSDFEGDQTLSDRKRKLDLPPRGEVSHASAVDARDAKLHFLYHRYLSEGTALAEDELIEEIDARRAVRALGAQLRSTEVGYGSLQRQFTGEVRWTKRLLSCHHEATLAFALSCGWSEGRLPLARVLYELCERAQGDATQVSLAVGSACAAAAANTSAPLVV